MALASPNATVPALVKKFHTYGTVRSDLALTTSYVASDHFDVSWATVCDVLIAHTWSSATSIEWLVEWSHDASTWFRSINVSPSAGTNTITANNATLAVTASVNVSDGNIPVEAAYVRVQIKRTGGSASDTASIVVHGIARE